MKKILKKKGGFTLVELIVVIAILAILAAVAIPAYSGYISKAKDAADLSTLDAVLTAAQGALAQKGTVSEVVVTTGTTPKVEVKYKDAAGTETSAGDLCASANAYHADFALFFTDSLASFQNGKDKATWPASATDKSWKFE